MLAPSGATRRDLAVELAAAVGGRVVDGWHLDSEPSAHRDLEVFLHLTPSFDVLDAADEPFVRLVDDVTIIDDLDRAAPAPDGWHRVLSDDARFLRMLEPLLPSVGAPGEPAAAAAERLGLLLEDKGDALRLHDRADASVALITGVRADRQRVAECISPPLDDGPEPWFGRVAEAATAVGCTVPVEAATHLHYDAGPFRAAPVVQRLVWAFAEDHEAIRARFGTNTRCRRTGALSSSLVEVVDAAGFAELPWPEAAEKLRAVDGLTKYADVNLLHLVAERPRIDTVEFRMLPGTLDPEAFAVLCAGVDALVEHLVGDDEAAAG